MATRGEDGFYAIDPAELTGEDAHRLLLHCVAPRPIAFTSTVCRDGVPNLAPFSYFMVGGANPCSVAISPVLDRAGQPKDTLRNIEETREYVINIVTYAMREQMNRTAAEYPYGVSEWAEVGLTPAPCVVVNPPRVRESPLALECRLHTVVRHGNGPLSANYVIGEVVQFHVAESVMPNDVLEPRAVDYLARMGGDWYARINAGALFSMPRPAKPRPPDAGRE